MDRGGVLLTGQILTDTAAIRVGGPRLLKYTVGGVQGVTFGVVRGGAVHVCATKARNSTTSGLDMEGLVCWGDNSEGQLLDDTNEEPSASNGQVYELEERQSRLLHFAVSQPELYSNGELKGCTCVISKSDDQPYTITCYGGGSDVCVKRATVPGRLTLGARELDLSHACEA
eukprot:3006667-Rhodomonas_salina.1